MEVNKKIYAFQLQYISTRDIMVVEMDKVIESNIKGGYDMRIGLEEFNATAFYFNQYGDYRLFFSIEEFEKAIRQHFSKQLDLIINRIKEGGVA